MFVQIMKGHVDDEPLLQRQMDAWRFDVRPGAIGFLGSTGGVTDDGLNVVIARFESPEAAQANSARAEQGEWWNATEGAFSGPVTFYDCTEVDLLHDGGSDKAGFVQIIEGKATDKEALRALGNSREEFLRNTRPDVLGGLVAWHSDREFVQAVYFSDEASARAGEASRDGDSSSEWLAMLDGPPTFIDLKSPVFD